ncbi:MAG: LCP family protein [Clostridia bacterium]|nr:LCP family protein [Clostridia bacterium]
MPKNTPQEDKEPFVPQNTNEPDDDISQYYPDGDYQNMEDDDEDYQALLKKKQKIRRKRGRMTRSQRALIFGIFIVYAVVLCIAAWMIFYRPAVPGGETDIPFDTNPVTQETVAGEDVSGVDKTDTENTDGDGYTIQDGMYNILVVGHDRAASLADVIMLVNCDTIDGDVTVMQLPRDTCVQNFVTNKINAAYSTYYNAALKETDGEASSDAYLQAVNDLATLLEQSLCIQIHHTAVLNLDGLVNIVNALGGVELYVPQNMYYSDPEQGLYIDLAEGYQTLTGEQAEDFVRFRSGYTQADLGRVNAQKIFLTALLQKVKSSFSLSNTATLTKVAEEIFRNLHTDLKVSDILFYAKFLLKVDLENMNMTTIPGNAVYASNGQSYYVINRAATLDIVNRYYNIYKTEITDSIFDRNTLFCLNDGKLTPYYYADTDTVMDEMYNGRDINDNSIDIP